MNEVLKVQLDERSAVISACGFYRYSLTRRWSEDQLLYWIMLNPSTADASKDDPTIRKCIGFAKHNGFGGIRIFNLFAWRATDPRELALYEYHRIVGKENDDYIQTIPPGSTVVAGWGAFPYGKNLGLRIVETRKLLEDLYPRWACVKKSGEGIFARPWHPLYVKYGELTDLWTTSKSTA